LPHVATTLCGLCLARNLGVTLTTAEIIAFSDDDGVVTPTWAAAIASEFEGHPEVAVLCGRCLPWGGATPGRPLRSAEGIDLICRLLRRGHPARYSPAAVVYHRRWRDPAATLPLERGYQFGAGAFLAKQLRQGDPRAALLLVQRLWQLGLREVAAGPLRHDRRRARGGLVGLWYPLVGALASRRYRISPTSSTYYLPGGPSLVPPSRRLEAIGGHPSQVERRPSRYLPCPSAQQRPAGRRPGSRLARWGGERVRRSVVPR